MIQDASVPFQLADGTAVRCALIFYDNAGEHFQPGVNVVEQPGAQHVASAAGIVYLFDPFNSPEFRRRLHDTKDPQMERPIVDQQDIILAEMRARILSIRNMRVGDKITRQVPRRSHTRRTSWTLRHAKR